MAKTALLSLLPAALVATGWAALEQDAAGGPALAMVALALVAALPRRPLVRLVAALVTSAVALQVALSASILDARPFDGRDFFGPAAARFLDGVTTFYEVRVPFVAADEPRMHGIVLLAIFGFCLAGALAVAAERPLLAGLALVVGAAWPATLVPSTNEAVRGALILGAILVLLAALRRQGPRGVRHIAVAGSAVVACALAASASPAVAKDAFLDWQHWNPTKNQRAVSVRYVWDANYDGVRFPKERTTVLRIRSDGAPRYWRATALDSFSLGLWREDLPGWVTPRRDGDRDVLLADPLLGPRARSAEWTKQEVEVEGLADNHLIGASVPVAFDPGDLFPVVYGPGGIAFVQGRVGPGARYTVWSYAPEPRPRALTRLGARYPHAVRTVGLSVERGITVPPFGAKGRRARMRAFFAAYAYDERIRPYRPLYEKALEIAGRSQTPYQAVVAVEAWLRSAGQFVYDEQPPRAGESPALVDFVLRTRRGYCQHFAGAMAIMLRYLGIPARVAAGFTSGKYDADERTWTVTDHDAHTWVEAWFPGFGWLPFDPTPGRGGLAGEYTAASPGFNVNLILGAIGGAGADADLLRASLERGSRRTAFPSGIVGERLEGEGSGSSSIRSRGGNLLGLLALVAAALLALVAVAKVFLRRARYLTRDPRQVAGACRQELVDFLVDQGLDVPRSTTMLELAELVESELTVPATHFVGAVSAARFGPPEGSAAAATRSRRELRMLMRQIRRRLTPASRLRGLVSLRSLGFT